MILDERAEPFIGFLFAWKLRPQTFLQKAVTLDIGFVCKIWLSSQFGRCFYNKINGMSI
jgi:hypothetical protein